MDEFEKYRKPYPQDKILKYTFLPLIPSFITPNILTIIRYVLTPIVLALLYFKNYSIGVPLFIFAAFTDMLDGSMARTKDKITKWGILNDPIADKILVGSVLIVVTLQYINPIIPILVILLDVLTLVGGLYLKSKGTVIGSNIVGKIKLVCQVFGLISLMVSVWFDISFLLTLSIFFFVASIVLATANLLFVSGKYIFKIKAFDKIKL